MVRPYGQADVSQGVQPLVVEAQWLQVVMGAIMAIWVGAWVLSQVIKAVKGEEVEKPPLTMK